MNDSHDGEDGDVCPICLTPCNDKETSLVFCRAPCSHLFCQPCADRVFLAAGARYRRHDDSQYDKYFKLPTLGRCPLCRTGLDLFDLKVLNSDEALYPKSSNVTSWPIYQYSFDQQQRQNVDNTISMIFKFLDRPIVEFSGLVAQDGTLVESAEFDDDSHFFEKSTTFHGSVSFDPPVGSLQYSSMDCLFQFSRDCLWIRDGYIRWKHSQVDDPSDFPMDGVWRVTWASGDHAVMSINRHDWSLFGWDYQIEIGSEEDGYRPHFQWPRSTNGDGTVVVQSSAMSIPPGTTRPGIGESMEWTTTDPQQPSITWTRLSFEAEWDIHFLSESPHVYRRMQSNLQDEVVPPSYHGNSIWGNVFCQGLVVGLASYHFVAQTDTSDGDTSMPKAYISYESPQTSVWPNLDDGSPIPARVPFRDIEWDESGRVFRGNICWWEDYGTTWQGNRKWSYEMKFDSNFTFIVSGTVLMFTEDSEEHHETHAFGQDLVYINACTKEYVASAQPDLDLLSRWEYEGASERTLHLLLAVYRI